MTDQMNLNWNTGIPIFMEYLMQLLHQHVVSGKLFDAVLKYSKAQAQKKFQQWLRRAVLKSNFIYWVESISQKDTGGLAPLG